MTAWDLPLPQESCGYLGITVPGKTGAWAIFTDVKCVPRYLCLQGPVRSPLVAELDLNTDQDISASHLIPNGCRRYRYQQAVVGYACRAVGTRSNIGRVLGYVRRTWAANNLGRNKRPPLNQHRPPVDSLLQMSLVGVSWDQWGLVGIRWGAPEFS